MTPPTFLTRLREPDNCGTAFHRNEIISAVAALAVAGALDWLGAGHGILILGVLLAVLLIIGRGAGDAP